MKKTILSLLLLFVACAIARAANPCIEGGPYPGPWSCRWSGAVLNTGSLSITSIVMCVGETVQTPTAYGITFTNGMKRRVLTYDCPQNPPQTQDVAVVYVPSAITYVDGSGNPIPAVFTNAGTYTYTGQAYGVAVGGVCGNTAVFNVGTLTVQVWGTGDSDYDGFSDCQEAKDGTDPYSSGLLTEMWLGYWRFNDTNWLGDFGQIPVTHTNLQSVPGLNVKAVGVNSNTVARLTYRDVETNGWANVNVRQGTIRFWFRPSWASTNSGGAGPQSETRLFEMGDEVVGSPTGWWALVMNNAGNQIRFVTQTNGVGRTNLMASVNWSAEQWYQIAITYSSTNSRLYVNGQAVGTNGLGVAHYPGPSVRNQGFRVGSDKDGNRQAKGRFDDLETFNYAQSAQTVSNVYAWRAAQMATNTPNLNSCVLRPITIKHSIMSTVAVNSTFTIQRGTGPGNFSWVEGNKHDHTNPKVLANQLTNATGFAYIRSDNAADDVVSIGDWISGVPGNKKAIHIREALDYLITNQIPITLPVWSTNRNPGANMEYQVTNFAQVRVVSYTNLDENNLHKSNFTFTFFYLGSQVCETRTNTAPQVSAGPGQTICFGSSATLAGSATDDGLPAPAGLTFAWSKVSGPGTVNFVNQGATNTSASFTLPGIYRLQLLASDGELTGVDTVDINVQTNTTAVGPGSQTHCPGANVVFSTTPAGTGPFTFVWLKDGSVLAGQTSSSLTLNNITVASGGTYTVRVTGTCGSVTNNAMLTVYTPTTATGPSNLIRNPGQNATFTVTAAGAAPFSYVWRKDGVVIPGQTTSSLNLGNVTLANAGTYCVEVTGLCNSVTNCATLTVRQPPLITIISPLNGDAFAAPALIRIRTEPFDPDGIVTNVQFLSNSVVVGSVTNSAYFWTLTNLASGTYTFGAIATDNDGLTGTAVPVTITVQTCPTAALSTITLSTNNVLSGGSLVGTVTLGSAAMTGGQVVSLSTANPAVLLPPSVFVAQGQTSTNFTIRTERVAVTNFVTISARYHAQTLTSGTLTLVPNGGISGEENPNQSSGLLTTNLTVLTPEALVREIVGENVEFTNVRFTGTNLAAGVFAGGSGIVGFEKGIILSSGNISNVVGPNDSDRKASMYGLNGDDDLDELVAPELTEDATILEFDFIPSTESITWDYVFASEEYNEFSKFCTFEPFNDVFAFFLNGQNVAVLTNGTAIAIDNVNAHTNAFYYINNSGPDACAVGGVPSVASLNIQMDGLTKVLTVTASVSPGVVNHIKLAIADTGDANYDSVVMIRAHSFQSGQDMVFTRDDLKGDDYSAFRTTDSNRLSASREPAGFDLRYISGTTKAGHFERAGQITRGSGTRFDVEWGMGSLAASNLNSFGPVRTNGHLLPVIYPYNLDWELPATFYSEFDTNLGSTYFVKLIDRISSLCGNTVELDDLPHSDWPVTKNILTLKVSGDANIPQGRARGVILTGASTPLNGSWDVVLNGSVVAASGMPNGWSVEEDYTVYKGLNVGVPANAIVTPGYQVRFVSSAGIRSGFITAVSSNTLKSAPILLPLKVSSKTVTGAVPVTVTVTLDAPANGIGAFVSLKWDGLSGGTLPTHVVIPTGQRTTEFTFLSQTNAAGSNFVLRASYNGYRKALLFVLPTGGSKPPAPLNLDATGELGRIKVVWNPVAGAHSYNLKRSTVSGGPYTLLFEGLTTTNYVDTHILPDTNYCYVVTAVNANGESATPSNQDCAIAPAPTVVNVPLIQPASGSYNDSVIITMTTGTPGASIWYTVDGTTPQNSAPSIQYTTPFTINTSAVIRAIGFRTLAIPSAMAVSSYTIVVPTPLSCDTTNAAVLTSTNSFSTNRGAGFFVGRYTFPGIKGRQVTISMSSTNVDSYLYLVDPTGKVVAENDDASGLNSQIVYTIQTNGTFYVEATTAFPGQLGHYKISLLCVDIPELNVRQNGTTLVNNSLLDFGVTTVGANVQRIITVSNSGSANLIISNLTVAPSGRFTFSPSSFSPIAPDGSVNITLTFVASVAGPTNATFSFRNNDAAGNDGVEDPFIISLTGRANIAGTPPTVSITSPSSGAVFTAPAAITINANAAAGSSSVADVSFYRITASGPVLIGVDMVSPYSVVWSGAPAGSNTLQAIATDSAGRVTTSSTISIFVNRPPVANPDERTVAANSSNNTIEVLPNDADPDGHTLSVTGNSTPAHGSVVRNGNVFSYTPTSGYVGKDSFTYNLSDGNGGTAVGTVTVKIPPTTVPAAPVAAITTPTNGTHITSRTNVLGTAQSAYLDVYELLIRPAGDESATWVRFATGTTSVTGGALGVLDPSMLLNGSYDIVLFVTDLVGQEAFSSPVTIVVTDKLKVGHFTLSFKDLEIPVAGLPITINRTYDSRNQSLGEFGVGWTLDISSVRLQKNMPIGEAWQGNQSGFTFCIGDIGPHVITITFPDGTVHGFRPVAKPNYAGGPCGNNVSSLVLVRVDYEALPGSFGQLTSTTVNDLWVSPGPGGLNGEVTIVEDTGDFLDPFGPVYDPSGFIYTARDGRRYEFNAEGRLLRMTDRADNSLTFTDDGITHSSGKGVKFVREGRRIVGIYDPLGLDANGQTNGPATILYKHDGLENLTAVQRLVNRNAELPTYLRTSFFYTNVHYPNYLTSIKDPRGVVGIRTEFDDEGRVKAIIDADGNATTFSHDLTGRREIVVDRLGNTNVMAYDTHGNVIATTNAIGRVTLMGYDENNNRTNDVVFLNGQPLATNRYEYVDHNRLKVVINALGESNRFSYNNFGQVEIVTDPRGFSLTNSYDPSNGDLLLTRDPLGNATENAYDDRGLVKGSRTPVGAISTNYYDAYGSLLASASYDLVGGSPVLHTTNSYAYDANGNRTNTVAWRRVNGVWVGSTNVFVYDAQNRLTKAIDESGTNITVYNAIGQAEIITDKLGRTTRYDYDLHGRLTKTTYPDNSFDLSQYDAAGRRTNSVDRAGRATAYSYDALGQLTQVAFVDGSATRTVYDALGRLRFRVDAMGVTNAYGYNAAGRLVSVTNALGVAGIQTVYGYGYDAGGNTIYFTNALNVVTTNVYDALGRLVQIKNSDGTTVSTAYDGVGRKVALTNQDNVVTLFGYDGLGQLVAVTNALGTPEQVVTRYEYDQAGNLLKIIDALNRTNSYTYDNLGRRLSHTMPNPSQVERFAYDRAGNPVYHTNFNNVVITNQYDVLDRLTNRASISGYRVAFTYGPIGERLTMTDPSGSTTYGYDTRGRLLLKTVNWAGGPSLALNYLYDARGNVTNIFSGTSGGVNLYYQYDALARITNVLTAGSSAAAYRFDANGNLKAIRYGNGITNLFQYDSLNRLTNSTWWSNQVNLATFYYRLGKAGNRTNLTEFVKDTTRTKAWSYDSLYRVTSESISDLGNLTYGYDKVGNRTNRQSTVVQLPTANYSYNTNDWLAADTYDNNGNTTAAGVNTYNYDPVNQVTNVNSGAVRMWYDGDGLRVKKQVGTTVTYYLWDDRNLSGYVQVLEEHKSVGGGPATLDKAYDYGLDLVRQRQGATSYYFGYDGQGSTRFLIDGSGAVFQTFAYDAYGTLIASNGSPATVYLYCGEQFDPDIGFYYLRARFLNPSTGRFQTMDSFAGIQNDPLSLHKYLYASDDPVNRIDPTGHESLVGVSVGSSIAGSLSAMYNGVVSAVGTALQMTIMGVHAGKSAEEILLEFILDQTGLQLIIDAAGLATDLFSSIKDLLLKQMGEEEVNIAEFYVSFDTYVMPWITDEPEGLDVADEIFSSPQCLAAGTLIETDEGYKPIEQVQAGDWVWAWNNDANGRELKKVLRTFTAERAELVEIRVNGALIVTTIEHPFFTRDRVWKAAGHLAAGDALFDEGNPAGHVIDSVMRAFDTSTVYNMEVEDLHNYFVTEEGILTHNLGAGYNHFFQNAFVKATRGNSIKYGAAALKKARYLGKAAHKLFHKKFNAFLEAEGMLPGPGNPARKIVKDKGLDFEQLVTKFRKFYSEEKWGAKPEWKALFEEEVRVLRANKTSIP